MPDSLVDKRLRYIERQRQLHQQRVNVVFEGRAPGGTGPENRHGMPKLPVGQRQVPNWPVLDLGDSPIVPLDDWRLEVGGRCDNPFTLTWQQFLELPQAEDVSDFHCVTTWSRMDNRWQGVRFKTIAELAIPLPDATHVICYGYDHMPGTRIPYSTNLPLARTAVALQTHRLDIPTAKQIDAIVDQLNEYEKARKNGRLKLPDGDTPDITKSHKTFWPAIKKTMGDLIRYYLKIAPFILPVINNRPLVMNRLSKRRRWAVVLPASRAGAAATRRARRDARQ